MNHLPRSGPSASKSTRLTLFSIVTLQLLSMLIVSLIWAFHSWQAVFSSLLGGATIVLPSFYLAWRLSVRGYARQAGKIVQAFYLGEVIKLVSMVGLIIVAVRLYNISFLPFLCGLLSAQVGVWMALYFKI